MNNKIKNIGNILKADKIDKTLVKLKNIKKLLKIKNFTKFKSLK